MGNFLVQYVACSTHEMWWNGDFLKSSNKSSSVFFFFFLISAGQNQNSSGRTIRVFIRCNLYGVSPYRCMLFLSEQWTWKHKTTCIPPSHHVSCGVKEDKTHDNEWYIEGCAHSHQSVWKYPFLAILYLIQFISSCFTETQSLKQLKTAFCNREKPLGRTSCW